MNPRISCLPLLAGASLLLSFGSPALAQPNPALKSAQAKQAPGKASGARTAPAARPAPRADLPLPPIERVASVEGVTEYRLPNGLRVLLLPDSSIETVTVNVTYLVGSRHEGYGEAGMAHLLEHLLFRGTPKNKNIKGEFQSRGARWNGTTSFDRTNYFETFPASEANLAWALDLEADRMVNSFVSKADLEAEMTVVRNEFESGQNSPSNLLRERITATAYSWHNYGRAVIGARSDIENVPIERLQAFYRTWYQPDNAVLIIAGKFDEAAALKLVQSSFGRLPRPTRILPTTYTVEPPQDGERNVVLRRVGDVQMVAALYHLPPGSHEDYAAVDIAVAILGQVPGGRLHKALVTSGKATSVFGGERQQREAGFAYFNTSLRTEQSADDARAALIQAIEGLQKQPFTDEEVNLVRTRMLNETEMLLNNTRSLAMTLSETSAMGDWRLLFLHRDRLRKVTTAEVQRVALAYFKSTNRTVGTFVPTANPDRAEIPAVPDVAAMVRDYRGEARVAQGENFQATPANIEARVIRRELPGGMKLAMLPRKTRGGTVVAQLGLRWGDEATKAGRSAACGIASAMLMRGSQKRNREQLRNEFDRLKTSVGVGGDGASIETVRENLPHALQLVAEVLRQPAFPEPEFEQLRGSSLASIESQRSDPGSLAAIELGRYLNPYPPEHWLYTPSIDERIARLKGISIADVHRCHQDFYGASNSELSIVGDFDPDELLKLATELFGDWKSPKPYTRIPYRIPELAPLARTIETPDKANAVLRAGIPVRMRDDNPDYPAMVLANYLLGGSSDARLARRIREKEGLSYSVGSFFNVGTLDERSDFGISAIYAPQNRDKVQRAMLEELRRALDEGFDTAEVDSAKKGLLQARQLARTQDGALAGRLLAYLVVGRTFEWDTTLEKRIAELTPKDVQDALRKYVDPTKLSIVVAGDFEKVTAAK